MSDSLFPEDGLRITPVEPWGDERTTGQKMRDRQAARIRRGYRPLPFGIPLHPDAPRVEYDDGNRKAPLRCGSCKFRKPVGGHARDFPKCMFGYEEISIPEDQQRFGRKWKISMPRVTMGEASDVRAWWPACKDYEPKSEAL